MEKKEYTKPAMRLFNIHNHERLLQTASQQQQQNKLQLFDEEEDYIDNEFGVM